MFLKLFTVLALIQTLQAQLPPFGRSMRDEFLMDPHFLNLNHGAYGTYPRYVQTALHKFQERAESNSDLWIRRDARVELDKVRLRLAELIRANASDIVMIPNATSGMNAILRSLIFNMNDRIVHFSNIYNSMRSIIQYLNHTAGVIPLEFDVTFPMSNDDLVRSFEQFLDDNYDQEKPIRLALIDHISSSPAVMMPIERIIPILKERNILVLIDGAHAVGQVPINMTQLNPDFYITNCHKWLYAPRGCSLMYVEKASQDLIHPAHIASNYGVPSRFEDEFFWTGTMDYSPYMAVTAALEFRQIVGGEEQILNYTHSLARQGGKYLADTFGTRVLQAEDQMGSIVDVQLPINNPDDSSLTNDFWIDILLYRYNMFAPAYKHGGQWWIRVSSQIYNDIQDFETAAQMFLEICNELNTKSENNSGNSFTFNYSFIGNMAGLLVTYSIILIQLQTIN